MRTSALRSGTPLARGELRRRRALPQWQRAPATTISRPEAWQTDVVDYTFRKYRQLSVHSCITNSHRLVPASRPLDATGGPPSSCLLGNMFEQIPFRPSVRACRGRGAAPGLLRSLTPTAQGDAAARMAWQARVQKRHSCFKDLQTSYVAQ